MALNIIARTDMYEGSTRVAGHVFIANNYMVRFASFVSKMTSISFKYFIKNLNSDNKNVNVRIAHVVVTDPEWKSLSGVVVTGHIIPVNEQRRVTDIELTIKPDQPKLIIRPVVEFNIKPGEERERSSTLVFGLTGALAKDATCFLIIDEWVIDPARNVEKLVKRYLFEHQLILVDNDSPSKYAALEPATVAAGGGVPTHIIILEGDASHAVGGVTNALMRLQNTIVSNIPQLNNVFGAAIQDVKSAKVTTADGKVKAKTAFLVREGSPIAPLTIIILAVLGLAAIAGILFAIGTVLRVMKEEKQLDIETQLAETRTQIAERTVASTSELANSIVNNPSLSTEEKQKLLDALSKYTSSLTQNIERSTSLLPPYLLGLEMDKLTLILLVSGLLIGGGIGAYVFGEFMKTRRTELMSLRTTREGG